MCGLIPSPVKGAGTEDQLWFSSVHGPFDAQVLERFVEPHWSFLDERWDFLVPLKHF